MTISPAPDADPRLIFRAEDLPQDLKQMLLAGLEDNIRRGRDAQESDPAPAGA